jgi:hypothetical protein
VPLPKRQLLKHQLYLCCLLMLHAVEHTHRVIMDHKTIATTYMRTWLVLDVVSAVPYSYLEDATVGFLQLFKVRRVVMHRAA